MPVGMAVDVHGNRKACDMAGMDLHMDCQGSNSSSQSLRADPQIVYLGEQFLLQLSNFWIRIGFSEWTDQRLFGKERCLFKGSADPHPHNNRWTGICTGFLYPAHNKLFNPFNTI